MYLPSPMLILTILGLLLHHGLGGNLPTRISPRKSAEVHKSTRDSRLVALHTLLSSISPKSLQFQLSEKGISCSDLMPNALEHFNQVPQQAQILIHAALVLTLQGAGCSQHAEALGLDLYKELGQTDASVLLATMIKALVIVNSTSENKSFAALQFNLDQLAHRQAWHCQGLVQVKRAFLHGQVYQVYRWFTAAASACRHLGSICAGVVRNSSSSFQVVVRDGSFFQPHRGAHSWLHLCHGLARVRRSSPGDCLSQREQKVHTVLAWLPGVSTTYNFATSIYFATQDCSALAKERAIEGAMDLGYDALIAMTGGTGSILRMGISAAFKPAFKRNVQALVKYFNQEEELPYPIPTSYSGQVIII